MSLLDDVFVYDGAEPAIPGADAADDVKLANAARNIRVKETASFKSNMLDKTGLSVQAFEHSRATLAGVHGKSFALARDQIFQSMMDEISDAGVKYMNQLITRAKVRANADSPGLPDDYKAVAVEPKRIPRSLAKAFAENYVRAVSSQLMDDLELLFPSEYTNYSILNIKRGDEAEKPVIPRP